MPFFILPDSSFRQLRIEIAAICRLGALLLFLLFQSGRIEFAIRCRRSVFGSVCRLAILRLTILWLLGLFLFRESLEKVGDFIYVFVTGFRRLS